MSRSLLPLLLAMAVLATSCGGDADAVDDGATRVVVTTSVLGEVVTEVLAPDEDVVVEVLLPPGADPHGYAPSAADAVALREADVVYAVGLGLEEALADSLAAAEQEGVRIERLGERVDPLPFGEAGAVHDEHEGDEHDEGDGLDPHVWLDPVRVARLGSEVAAVHAELAPATADAVSAAAAELAARMEGLDADLAAELQDLPADRRRLVTNHDALGYLAARYDLEVVATVLPGTSADVDVASAAFTQLVELLRETGIPAVFADTTSSDRLAQALAAEVDGVEVVELYTGALGQPGSGADTIDGMLRTNVARIADALG